MPAPLAGLRAVTRIIVRQISVGSTNVVRIAKLAPTLVLAAVLTACSGVGGPDLKEVLSRTMDSFDRFDTYMKKYDYTSLTPALMSQLETWLNDDLNRTPHIHNKKIATRFNKDASIDGHSDLNGNGKVDNGEPRLFKVELDVDNRRLIATAEGGGAQGYHPRTRGFMTGVMVGSILNQQRSSGIRFGHFARRSVAGASISEKVQGRVRTTSARGRVRTPARGRARSGGVRAGK